MYCLQDRRVDNNISPQQDKNERGMVCELSRTNRKIKKRKPITKAEKSKNAHLQHVDGAWQHTNKRRIAKKRKH